MSGKVVWHMTMSVDGFIGDRDDRLDWSFGENEPSELAAEVIRTTGAFLCGGRLVDVVGENRPYGGAWAGPVLILTHKDPTTNPAPDQFTYVSGDIRDVIADGLKAADGKNLVVTGGAVPRLTLDAGLVDEIVLHIVPVLLGEGVRFYDSPGVEPTKLKVLTAERTNFRFEVVK
ncbi:MAG TPA: dihydrofolate reductase family protein [Kribbella sp.]|nr:dihydrofolate reductase family protein [Kribbella sp.]